MQKKQQSRIKADSSLPAPVSVFSMGFSITPWYAIAGLLVLCVFFFGQVIFGAGNFWEDFIQLEFPNRVFARDSFLNLEFPHWNPYSYNGMPFFATQLPGVLYPPNILISLLPFGLNVFWYCVQMLLVVHYAIAGIVMFYFLKGKKYGQGAAFFGAIGYMFCGFSVVHAVHPMMINVVVWLPFVLYFLDRALIMGSLSGALIGGLILGATTLSGHPQITIYEFLFIAVYSMALFLTLEKKKWTRLLMPVVLLTVGMGISMVQTLPSIELNGQAARVEWTFEAASEGSISFRQLITVVLPKLFGAWTGGSAEVIPPFWLADSYHSGYYTYWETCFYPGIVILLLAVAFIVNQRKKKYIILLALWLVFSMAFAMGSHFFLYKIMFDYVPGFNRFRSPGRMLFAWNFVMALLAAGAFDGIKGIHKKDRFFKIVLGGAFLCLIIGLAAIAGFFSSLWPEMNAENRASFARTQGWILCLNAVLVIVPVIMYLQSWISVRPFKGALCCALVADLFIFGWGHHIVKEPQVQSSFGGNKALIEDIKKQTGAPFSRVSIRQFTLEQKQQIVRQSSLMVLNKCQGMIDRFQTVEGYTALSLLRRVPPANGSQFQMFLDLLNVSFYINPSYGRNSPQVIIPNPSFLPRAKMFYRAKIFENDSLLERFMTSGEFDYKEELLLTENPGISLADSGNSPVNTVRMTKYGANKILLDVETKSAGLLWMSEIWFSAWKARIDGKPAKVFCADKSFRAIVVPAGAHTVEYYYSSRYFIIGGTMTLITMILSVIISMVSVLKKRRDKTAAIS
jgi:hypothetical protein